MARHEARGTKRKCQNEDCALPFYDLNRSDYVCPNCGSAFDANVPERLAPTARHVAKPLRGPHIVSSLREPAELAQDEEIEPAAATGEASEEPEDERGADPILEQEEEDEDGIVVNPSPDGRIED